MVSAGAALPGAGRRAARPSGGVQRLVRRAERHRLARLLHLQVEARRCLSLAEVLAPTAGVASLIARCRLAAEPTLPHTADLATLTAVSVQPLGRGRWHVHMAAQCRVGRRVDTTS